MDFRQAPARFFEGAPAIVRRNVLDLVAIKPAAPLDYDVVLKPRYSGTEESETVVGLDFGEHGEQGCHFFLKPHEARAYRERNRRKRVAWKDLPAATQSAIVDYLED